MGFCDEESWLWASNSSGVCGGTPQDREDMGVLGLGENGVLCLTGPPAGSPVGRVGEFLYLRWE